MSERDCSERATGLHARLVRGDPLVHIADISAEELEAGEEFSRAGLSDQARVAAGFCLPVSRSPGNLEPVFDDILEKVISLGDAAWLFVFDHFLKDLSRDTSNPRSGKALAFGEACVGCCLCPGPRS